MLARCKLFLEVSWLVFPRVRCDNVKSSRQSFVAVMIRYGCHHSLIILLECEWTCLCLPSTGYVLHLSFSQTVAGVLWRRNLTRNSERRSLMSIGWSTLVKRYWCHVTAALNAAFVISWAPFSLAGNRFRLVVLVHSDQFTFLVASKMTWSSGPQ